MSDRIIVMNQGTIEQIGDVDEVYQYPNNTFVAKFIGNPSMNFLECSLSELGSGSAAIELDGTRFEFPVERTSDSFERDSVILGVRPQHLDVNGPGERSFSGTLRLIEPLDDRALATIDGPQGEISALIPRDTDSEEGEEVDVELDRSELYLFDPETTELIGRSEKRRSSRPPTVDGE